MSGAPPPILRTIERKLYERAMRIDRYEVQDQGKFLKVTVRTYGMDQSTILYLISIAESLGGKFSIMTDKSGRLPFDASITVKLR